MNKSESKYYHTALRMDEALIALLEKKDLEYITVKEICHQAGVKPFHLLPALGYHRRPGERDIGDDCRHHRVLRAAQRRQP